MTVSKMDKLKVTILGCGWSGLSIGRKLSSCGAKVLGTTTSEDRLGVIREAGIEARLFDLKKLNDYREEALDAIFEAVDLLIITLPPSAFKVDGVFQKHQQQSLVDELKKRSIGAVLVFSSTAVYPDEAGEYSESDAVNRISRHSGIDLFEYEKRYAELPKLTVIRFGGLFGPGKDLSRMIPASGRIKNSGGVLNLTHLEDIVYAVHWIVEGEHYSKTYNLVSPEHPTREAFYKQLEVLHPQGFEFDEEGSSGKKVVSDLIQSNGYKFKISDPLVSIESERS